MIPAYTEGQAKAQLQNARARLAKVNSAKAQLETAIYDMEAANGTGRTLEAKRLAFHDLCVTIMFLGVGEGETK